MNSRTLPLGLAIAAIGLCAQPALAAKGDWILRGGVGVVDPKSDNLTVDLPAGLTGLPGDTTGEIQVDTGVSATIEATYMFADHWGVELLAAYPFSHDVDIDIAGVDGGEGSFPGGSFAAGKVKHLPPTLSLQYHFNPAGRFRPYIGAGINYTTFMSEKATGILSDIGVTDLKLDDSWGLAGQLGADIGITDNWFANVVVRYIDIDTDATLRAGGSLDIGTVSIDPWVYQAQIGYRFGRKAAPVAAAAAATAAPAAVPAAPPPPPPPPPPADSDRDGVVDTADRCPDTPAGATVDAQGCEQISLKLAFGNNSANLTTADKAILDDLVARLKARTSAIALSIEGHTDNTGADAYNQKLSERRAAAVKDYLVAAGIPGSSLSTVGYGESQPVADNATAEGRAENRRVTVRRVAN